MAYSWEDVQHLPHKVRNMVRRGYLLKVYNDKKILRGRVKTGDSIENDKLDIIHPIGYIAHVKPTEKTEVLTLDVGGDSSRRVILAVFGDREDHPQPDEGEQFNYAPGNKKIHMRMKMKKKEGGDKVGANGGKDSGRPEGIHSDADDAPQSHKTKKTYAVEGKEAIKLATDVHTFEGNVNIKGDLRISGEAYKPSDGEWLAGAPTRTNAEGFCIKDPSPEQRAQEEEWSKRKLADRAALLALVGKIVIGPNGEVIVNANLIVMGDLTVSGTITARDFVKA